MDANENCEQLNEQQISQYTSITLEYLLKGDAPQVL